MEPDNPNASYFNFNISAGSQFGPSAWSQVNVSNSHWSEFGFVKNQCNDDKVPQSPIDVCTAPEKHCLEFHETRPNVSYVCLYVGLCKEQVFLTIFIFPCSFAL